MIEWLTFENFYVYGFPVFGFCALLYPVFKAYVNKEIKRIRKIIMENYYT